MFNLYVTNQTELKKQITKNYRCNEAELVNKLLDSLKITAADEQKAVDLAYSLVAKVREKRVKGKGVDALMQEFKLSTNEGIALMCLAESLLRIPDKITQDKLIRDKISSGNWESHIKTDSMFVNAASWGLLITGKLVKAMTSDKMSDLLLKVVAKGGEPLIRMAMATAVRLMGTQFVMGETIQSALQKAVAKEKNGYKFSYDMLGEAAMNDEDANRYMQSYIDAIIAVGKANNGRGVHGGPGISVKLSAIHPRYFRSQYHRVMSELYPRLKQLYLLAKKYDIGLFIDAEEAERLEISLDLLEMLLNDKDLQGFDGIGFVIQAYQKRAIYVIDYVNFLAEKANMKLMVRLVKGAYWDSEIKKAQVEGQKDYPVFTRKFYTDLSYLACAQKLFEYQDNIYPLFATHNAHSLATIYFMGEGKSYEFQCLYGMGETLYDNIVGPTNLNVSCRVYAPVGTYETLLAYLVRRLLENGANSSFVHQIVDKEYSIEELVKSPIEIARKAQGKSNPHFTKPAYIYPNSRVNSKGLDLTDENQLLKLQSALNKYLDEEYKAYPLIYDMKKPKEREKHDIFSPGNLSDRVGYVIKGTEEDIELAIKHARDGFKSWSQIAPRERARILLNMADLMEDNYYELINILVREAGKTLNNAIAEVREAVDFCRYYGAQAEREFDNQTHKALGVLVCISPWNFPLAIFIGEISSCLAAGNTVIAKPSYQTSLVAFYAVELFYKAGIPKDVLQLIPGSGSVIGNKLTEHPDIKGVIFTGSTEVAQTINQNLSVKKFDSVLIAETGGQNAMIVDSSALPEQVVADVISSGFDSAGQRCSALRVLYLQADIADKTLKMLKGAMNELRVGDPQNLATDVGPVIDKSAQKVLLTHIEKMKKTARMFYQAPLSSDCNNGIYVAPTLIEIGSIKELEREVFGPVVHVIRFANHELDRVIDEINSSGYGLTQGLHSRVEANAVKVYENIKAGNIYINRNMVGAVVGVQPFGGEGMSGTGPKAGGPFYLYRLVNTKLHPQLDYVEKKVNFIKLNNFVSQLDKCGFGSNQLVQLKDFAEKSVANSYLNKQIELPGPTGERNFMFFAKRGIVACFANSSYEYAKQIIAAYATGNDVVIPENSITDVFKDKLSAGSLFSNDILNLAVLNVALIARDYPDKDNLRVELAKRDGCLVINLAQDDDGEYCLHLLLTERTVSINLTATGGNVQLMSINDHI